MIYFCIDKNDTRATRSIYNVHIDAACSSIPHVVDVCSAVAVAAGLYSHPTDLTIKARDAGCLSH